MLLIFKVYQNPFALANHNTTMTGTTHCNIWVCRRDTGTAYLEQSIREVIDLTYIASFGGVFLYVPIVLARSSPWMRAQLPIYIYSFFILPNIIYTDGFQPTRSG